MLGERKTVLTNRDWLNKLKVAIVQDDFNQMETLFKEVKDFQTSEIDEAKYLLKESFILSLKRRDEVEILMRKVKRNIEITKASITKPHHHRLNKKF